MEEALHGLITGILKMTYLSIFLRNCLKGDNLSTDRCKTKSGLMLRYRVERGAFLGEHMCSVALDKWGCMCLIVLFFDTNNILALAKISQVAVCRD